MRRFGKLAIGCAMGVFAPLAVAGTAQAQSLVYEPVNPSFGGNPFNSGHLLAIANAQNDYEPEIEDTSSQDALDRFVRSLQSRLLSSLSTQVANAIFGEDAQDEGTITFGDQTVTFVRTLEGIQLTITNADGSSTVITIPTFQTSGEEGDDDDEGEGTSSSKLLATDGRTSLRGSFEERVRVVEMERQLGLKPGSPRSRTPEAVLLTRDDPLSAAAPLASSPSTSTPRLARRDSQPIQ